MAVSDIGYRHGHRVAWSNMTCFVMTSKATWQLDHLTCGSLGKHTCRRKIEKVDMQVAYASSATNNYVLLLESTLPVVGFAKPLLQAPKAASLRKGQ